MFGSPLPTLNLTSLRLANILENLHANSLLKIPRSQR